MEQKIENKTDEIDKTKGNKKIVIIIAIFLVVFIGIGFYLLNSESTSNIPFVQSIKCLSLNETDRKIVGTWSFDTKQENIVLTIKPDKTFTLEMNGTTDSVVSKGEWEDSHVESTSGCYVFSGDLTKVSSGKSVSMTCGATLINDNEIKLLVTLGNFEISEVFYLFKQ